MIPLNPPKYQFEIKVPKSEFLSLVYWYIDINLTTIFLKITCRPKLIQISITIMSTVGSIWLMLFCCPRCVSLLMRGISWVVNLINLRKKERRFNRGKKVMRTGKKDLGGLQTRYRDIIGAQYRLARDHTDQRVPWINI